MHAQIKKKAIDCHEDVQITCHGLSEQAPATSFRKDYGESWGWDDLVSGPWPSGRIWRLVSGKHQWKAVRVELQSEEHGRKDRRHAGLRAVPRWWKKHITLRRRLCFEADVMSLEGCEQNKGRQRAFGKIPAGRTNRKEGSLVMLRSCPHRMELRAERRSHPRHLRFRRRLGSLTSSSFPSWQIPLLFLMDPTCSPPPAVKRCQMDSIQILCNKNIK